MTGQGREAIDALLAESFKELTLKQPIEKITIKEITDRAGLIRPTFYNHFQDKYELLEWIITPERIAEYYAQSMCYVVIRWIQSGMTISAKELIEIYDYMIKRSMDDILKEL